MLLVVYFCVCISAIYIYIYLLLIYVYGIAVRNLNHRVGRIWHRRYFGSRALSRNIALAAKFASNWGTKAHIQGSQFEAYSR